MKVLAVLAAALAFVAGASARSSSLSLHVVSETSTTITLGWTPIPGAGYRFQSASMAHPSHTWDASRSTVKFSKAAWYRVESLGVTNEGDYPPPTPQFTVGLDVYGALGGCGPSIDLSQIPDGTTVRFWAFRSQAASDWSNLDALIASAKAHGDHLIPVLLNQWTDCNGQTDDATYRAYVAAISTRYRDEATITMWQLGNELIRDCSWFSGVASIVKANDPNHPISYGAYNDGWHDTVCPGDGFVDYHDYGQGSTAMPAQEQARINEAGSMPVMIGESGIQSSVGLDQRKSWFESKIAAAKAAGVKLYMLWGWETGDGYGIFPGDPSLSLL